MSNRIDFFQPEQGTLALPAAVVKVFVDGSFCSTLEPIEIVRGQWPDFSSARLVYNPSSENEIMALEDIQAVFPMGKSLSIKAFYNKLSPVGSSTSSYNIFAGQIEKSEILLQGNKQAVEITARDFSAIMERITVYGQRIVKDTSSIFLPDFESVFNPDGRANASFTPIQVQGNSYKIFSEDNQNARLWKYAEVIQYLLCEYVTSGLLHIPSLERLMSLTDDQIVRDLDVTGLNLVESLQRCCERIGLKFKFIPLDESHTPSQAIVFYKNGAGRKVELNCQKNGQINISKTNIVAMHSKKNFQPVTHRFIGQGDYKQYEATFELIKAWDDTLEANTYDYFSPSTNPDFYKVRDVFRKWALNEAGDYSSSPYNRGQVFDFSAIFHSSDYVTRRRRFWPCLTTDSQNRSLGYFLQVSFDEGVTWWQYRDAFNILVNECGVWLSSDQLSIDLILASVSNKLRFRITASVISDQRLNASVADGPVNSVSPVVDHIVTLPRQFRYKKISSQSIFAGSTGSQFGISDETDDTDAIYEFIRHASLDSAEVFETIDVKTLSTCFDYQLGDIVTVNPDSRDLLSCRENRSLCQIEKVQMDFQNQCTNLKIVRKRAL